jgi:hypothetical protein
MQYREIIAVCFEIHKKHINTVCGQNVELLNIRFLVLILTGLNTPCATDGNPYDCWTELLLLG